MADILVRLVGGASYQRGSALVHLDQGMGGGKSHALIGLYHLVRTPQILAHSEIGEAVLAEVESRLGDRRVDLSGIHVVTLCADHMTPLAPVREQEQDGPGVSLWERFLWRLVCPDYSLFERYRKRQDQAGITEALRAVGKPVLILLDEIMEYVRQLDAGEFADCRYRDLAFIKALMDAVNDVPSVAMVIVLIATDRDPGVYGPIAGQFREEFFANVTRNGRTTAVSDAGDFAAIMRRRLFGGPAPSEVVEATARSYLDARTDQWKTQVFDRLPEGGTAVWMEQVSRTYPFHPDLMRLIEHEWARMAGYQRVRSTFALFARTCYYWITRARKGQWAPQLLSVGDLPLDDGDVREHLLKSGVLESEALVASFRQVITTDLADSNGRTGVAASLDGSLRNETWHHLNPRSALRMATATFLYSLAPRGGHQVGASEVEIRAAAFVPEVGFTCTDSETIFNTLTDPETGLGSLEIVQGAGGKTRRFRLTTRQTLRMLHKAERSYALDDPAQDDLALAVVATTLGDERGPFELVKLIRDDGTDAEPSCQRPVAELLAGTDLRKTRLLALDPRRWLLLNGKDEQTRRDVEGVFGIGPCPVGITNAATLVIVCANRFRWESQVRARARDVLAWERVSTIPLVQGDKDMSREVNTKLGAAREDLVRWVRRAFQHYAVLMRDADDELRVWFLKFEQDNKTALSGVDIWDDLHKRGRAAHSISHEVLLTILQPRLPVTLAEISEAYFTDPVYPILPGVHALQNAVWACLRAGKVQLTGRNGQPLPTPDEARNVAIWSREQLLTIAEPHPPLEPDLQPDHNDLSKDDDSRENEPDRVKEEDESDVSFTTRRGSLTMRIQGRIGGDLKDSLRDVLRRIINAGDMGLMEAIEMSLRVEGEYETLEALKRFGDRVPGAKPHLEELP